MTKRPEPKIAEREPSIRVTPYLELPPHGTPLLSERQRQVSVLFYVEDLSVIEIASALGISDGAVKFHLNQARERLRTELGADRADHDSV